MKNVNVKLLLAMLLMPLLLGAACAPQKPDSAQPSQQGRAPVPALPQEARQPTPPSVCSPTCSEGLTRLRTQLLDSLTGAAAPGSPANASTTR